MTERKPHHLNVVSDFYVEEGCCLCCAIPQDIAPTLFASLDEHEQCFVKRQPQSAGELDQMIEVMASQDMGCIRYRGQDRATIGRILEVSDSDVIDGQSPGDSRPAKSWWRRTRKTLRDMFARHGTLLASTGVLSALLSLGWGYFLITRGMHAIGTEQAPREERVQTLADSIDATHRTRLPRAILLYGGLVLVVGGIVGRRLGRRQSDDTTTHTGKSKG